MRQAVPMATGSFVVPYESKTEIWYLLSLDMKCMLNIHKKHTLLLAIYIY